MGHLFLCIFCMKEVMGHFPAWTKNIHVLSSGMYMNIIERYYKTCYIQLPRSQHISPEATF